MASNTLRIGLGLIAAAVLAAPLAGCRGERTDKTPREFFPDMDKQRKWDPQEATGFFADARTARTPVPNTVPFGEHTFAPGIAQGEQGDWAKPFVVQRAALAATDDGVYRGVERLDDGTDAYLDYIPVEVTREMLLHGQEKFNIYCAACHGYAGDGQGMVGIRWSYPPANLNGEVYRDRANRQGKDGYLFEVIRDGVWGPDGSNRMPGYARALSEMDSWAVVAYLRALQRSRGTNWADLPPDDRARLGSPTPAAEPGTDPAADTSMNGGAS